MGKLSKGKSFKEKFQDLKDLVNGKKSLDTLAKATMPGRTLNVTMRRTLTGEEIYFEDFDNHDKPGMNKQEYEAWLEAERQKGPIMHILHWISDDRNEPIIETENITLEDGTSWAETKQYPATNNRVIELTNYGENKKTIQVEIIKSNDQEQQVEPIQEPEPKRQKKAIIKKQQPVIRKQGNEVIGETFKMPAVKRELDPNEYGNLVNTVTRLFDTVTRFKI